MNPCHAAASSNDTKVSRPCATLLYRPSRVPRMRGPLMGKYPLTV